MRGHINSINSLDIPNLTYEDIRWHYGTGIAGSTGYGMHKKSTYRHGVGTNMGDIRLDIWEQVAYEVIKAHDDLYHFESLKEFLMEHSYEGEYTTNRGTKKLHQESLKLCVSQIYNDPMWVSFLAYNQKYRLDYLKSVPVVTVVTACCQKAGEIPLAQTQRASVSCPICGVFSSFEIKTKYPNK